MAWPSGQLQSFLKPCWTFISEIVVFMDWIEDLVCSVEGRFLPFRSSALLAGLCVELHWRPSGGRIPGPKPWGSEEEVCLQVSQAKGKQHWADLSSQCHFLPQYPQYVCHRWSMTHGPELSFETVRCLCSGRILRVSLCFRTQSHINKLHYLQVVLMDL